MASDEFKLDKMADAFDAAWKDGAGTRPNLAEFLKKTEPRLVSRLAELLIPLDIECRTGMGASVSPNDYQDLTAGGDLIAVRALKESGLEGGNLDETKDTSSRPIDTGGQSGGEKKYELKADSRQSLPSTRNKSPIIGPYKLLQRLGEGGMGTVWIAEQSHPVKRRVALKLIKSGVGSIEIIARFEGERQALSLMNHPNIARILDAGTTADGQPYFAMELVSGQTLAKYCDQNRLSINDRLQLFIDICAGVEHAHQKGIIHRDLKPANILVAVADGVAVPKVIDFGLAKAMESRQRLHDQSLFTGIGQILGTLKYMSPEQASLDAIDSDTRTDIYALGVILYELLAGSTPLDEETFKGAAVLKLLEMIREKEPVKPSSRLSYSGDSSASITEARRTDISSLNRILVGDLDWVVMKALEKDRTRRYESASSFAADIHRYLNNVPVIARPPSLNYCVRKFVRKNRVGVIAASLLTLALVGGIVGTNLAMFRAWAAESLAESRLDEAVAARKEESRQRQVAEERRVEAERERELAETRRQEAERNLMYAKKGNELLGSVFAGLDPQQIAASGRPLQDILRENLVQAVKELEGSAIGDPLEVAAMQNTLGFSLLGLGEPIQALTVFEKALATRQAGLGPDHPDTLISKGNLAEGYRSAGQLDKALLLLEQTLELSKAKLGPDHPDTFISMNNLVAAYLQKGELHKSIPIFEQVVLAREQKLGRGHPETQTFVAHLGVNYRDSGRIEEAIPLLEEATESSQRIPNLQWVRAQLRNAYLKGKRIEQFAALTADQLNEARASLPAASAELATVLVSVGMDFLTLGQYQRAQELLEEGFNIRQQTAPELWNTFNAQSLLGETLLAMAQTSRN